MEPDTPPALKAGRAGWLAHLSLLARLPYPAMALLPAIVAELRRVFRVPHANIGLADDRIMQPLATWVDGLSDAALVLFVSQIPTMVAAVPLDWQFATDGDALRLFMARPGYELSAMYRGFFGRVGLRWGMSVPLWRPPGEHRCGFVYLHRAREPGPFSDREQALLRQARDALRPLLGPRAGPAAPCPRLRGRAATLVIDADGRFGGRTLHANELLFHGANATTGTLAWTAPDVSALPPPARALVARALEAPPRAPLAATVELELGAIDFQAEALLRPDGAADHVVLRMQLMEPADLVVARELRHWPLSPQQKRVLVGSARGLDSLALARDLGVMPATLKSYVNALQKRIGLPTRQAIVARLLADAQARPDG